MVTYQYQPLERTDDGDEIRVLRLHPCLPGAPLTGSLIPHLLPFEQPESGNPRPSDNTNSYEAVSYHWGSDSTLPFNLLLTSSPTTLPTSSTPHIPLTPSQHDLLRQFALPHRPRTLWIDGLCIQQSNPAEKEQQIKLMRRIYHSAARVLVYLGPAAD
ncbi:heterokaryon incompatibility protein-domain-containing protein, partial [Schizothecium vesticola]